MSTDHRELLKKIRTFPSLIKYLRDELDWPISSGDFEELTYDYTPEELGIDSKNAAKIQEIKRLRPLSVNQPWGIFFVKFEPKRLPVVALRRILGRVVVKKRASANSAERAAWQVDDLLFVSNYGEGEERRINLAHFTHDKQSNLPTLKVLGWDNLDTPLHLDHVTDVLNEKLTWPEDEGEVDIWRETWRSAFTLRHREVITTSKALAIKLAELARGIRTRINAVLAIETEYGPVTKLMKAFQEALIHDLDEDRFADMYAQTIAYGLLSARIANPGGETTADIAIQLPVTNPFLKELMETFLDVGERRGQAGGSDIDFDELGVSEVLELLDAANMEAIVRDFGDRNPQEDPVIHFYEHFLAAYDKKQKMQRGVFYTPRPVVSYIVRSVDELLRAEFDLEDGLADITTWSDMAKLHRNLEIPEGISPNQAFVQILDPATGTGTFLVEVIGLIHKTMTTKWRAQGHGEGMIQGLWNDYVPSHLLPRLHGYELLMAPYAIAHLKIGLKLFETGYRFGNDERARVYLTNSLEPPSDQQLSLDFLPALAHEAQAVNEIKRKQRFTVVVGNPPYSGHSANKGEWISTLIADYYLVAGQPLGERNPKWLQDDYVKFIRLAQYYVVETGVGVFGMITNHSFLDNPTFRGMRHSLLETFSSLQLLDLHGNSKKRERSPDGSKDDNVFDIQQGVAISLGVHRSRECQRTLVHTDLFGLRSHKYAELQSRHSGDWDWKPIDCSSPHYLFFPQDVSVRNEYEIGLRLPDIMEINVLGFQSHRDYFAVAFTEEEIRKRIETFRSSQLSDEAVEAAYGLTENKEWQIAVARDQLRADTDWEEKIIKCEYRPFDYRACYFSSAVMDRPRQELINNVAWRENLCLNATRQTKSPEWRHVVVSNLPAPAVFVEVKDGSNIFPLWQYPNPEHLLPASDRYPNFTVTFLERLVKALNAQPSDPYGLPAGVSPEQIFTYAYAVFHSPSYRIRYVEFLKIDFPRLPLPGSLSLFHALARIGADLVALHIMESPKLADYIAAYKGPKKPKVGRVGWSDGTVWLDASKTSAREGHRATEPGTIGFEGVPEGVWGFHIGGYQVCHKWLKDRKGRTLTVEDIDHYQKIVVAINETIRIMGEIDEVIEEHGGWPDAFSISDE